MDIEKQHHHSFIVRAFSAMVEWGNEWLTLSHWFFKRGELVFVRIEAMMLIITSFCMTLPFWVDDIPSIFYPLLYAFFVQRIAEFMIVYSRNFILKRGRIYSHTQFHSDQHRGAWLILMFSLSVLQIVMVFASWTRLISFTDISAFTRPLSGLDSIYFSAVTFLTIGYGDIAPLHTDAKLLILAEGVITYFVLVVVINGLISTHFGSRNPSEAMDQPEAPKQDGLV
jgi:hypothetical protein